MAYRKKTLRQMPEHSRKLAKLIGEPESIGCRLKNELANIEALERWYLAEQKRQAHYSKQKLKPGELEQSNIGGHQC